MQFVLVDALPIDFTRACHGELKCWFLSHNTYLWCSKTNTFKVSDTAGAVLDTFSAEQISGLLIHSRYVAISIRMYRVHFTKYFLFKTISTLTMYCPHATSLAKLSLVHIKFWKYRKMYPILLLDTQVTHRYFLGNVFDNQCSIVDVPTVQCARHAHSGRNMSPIHHKHKSSALQLCYESCSMPLGPFFVLMHRGRNIIKTSICICHKCIFRQCSQLL